MLNSLGSRVLLVTLVACADVLLLLALARILAPAPIRPEAQASPTAAVAPSVSVEARALPPPSPSPPSPPSPIALPVLPTPSPSPSPEPVTLVAGELPPDTALLDYLPEDGNPLAVQGLQASCNRSGDSLGLLGAQPTGATVARYQVTIAPFHGDGTYLTDAAHAEIGGSINIVGIVQLFIGPPYQTQADVARDGTLGQVRFSGTSVDGKRGEGVVRWECSETKPL